MQKKKEIKKAQLKKDPKKAGEKKSGRPPEFNQKIADVICERIALGESLRNICKDPAMPAMATVFRWLTEEDKKTFKEQYAHAREEQTETLIDEIFDIADDGRNDWMEKIAPNGKPLGWIVNGEAVQRSKIRIEARQWYAGKVKPKKYGTKVELAGDPNAPLKMQVEWKSSE